MGIGLHVLRHCRAHEVCIQLADVHEDLQGLGCLGVGVLSSLVSIHCGVRDVPSLLESAGHVLHRGSGVRESQVDVGGGDSLPGIDWAGDVV